MLLFFMLLILTTLFLFFFQLISPEDLLNAAVHMEELGLPVRLENKKNAYLFVKKRIILLYF